jgi:tetratricopeptide (TPR) repeat protein
VLDLQTEIATEVATALKVTLLGDVSAKIELGGTRNPAAFDAYLRGSKAHRLVHADIKDAQTAISAYSEAVSLDPNYALAFAARSLARSGCALQFVPEPGARDFYDKALADARRSIDLAPDLAEGYWALGLAFAYGFFDFAQASGNYERAVALAPGNAEVLGASGVLAVHMGRFDAGIGAVRRAATLDPLSPLAHYQLGTALFWAHRYQEAVPSFDAFIVLDPDSSYVYAFRGLAYYKLGDYEKARLSCEAKGGEYPQLCLAVTYDRLGRHADAEAELAKMKAAKGDSFAYQYAETYAQWGKFPEALEWLEEAMRLRDSGLVWLKTDPLVDPLRQEPRFQAIERELKFPQ